MWFVPIAVSECCLEICSGSQKAAAFQPDFTLLLLNFVACDVAATHQGEEITAYPREAVFGRKSQTPSNRGTESHGSCGGLRLKGIKPEVEDSRVAFKTFRGTRLFYSATRKEPVFVPTELTR
jgi:hypothetical protein